MKHIIKPVRLAFTEEQVNLHVMQYLEPVPLKCTMDERLRLEAIAHRVAKAYFLEADNTATCCVIITDNFYNIHVSTGEIRAGAVYNNYLFTTRP